MKIALVVTGGLHPSGREQVMPVWLWLIERLARDHEVHAFVLRHLPRPAVYPLAGATIHDLGRPEGRWAQARILLSALRAAGPFDILHGFWADPAGVLVALAGRRLGVPTVVTCDSGEFASIPEINYGLQRHWRSRSAVALACRLSSRVHVATSFMQDAAKHRGYDAVRIPLGVEPARIMPVSERPEGPTWRLLQVASLNRVKDQTRLLQAVAIVRRTLDVHLDLIGEDTLNGQLQTEAADLGLADAVTFHGYLPNDELTPFHHAAHLYVQSSRHEAAGMAVLEAAAAGVPIVGTRAGFVSDWAPSGALAVPVADAASLAGGIVRLLHNAGERRAMARIANQFALQYDADWSAHALTELYRHLQ
jgi:glycosyltransferase involved in cell wall biosynthesis